MLPTIHHDLEPQKTKGRGWVVLLLIIILVAIASGAVYSWQKNEAKKLATTAEEKVRSEMQAKIDSLENKNIDYDKQSSDSAQKITELENNINKANQMIDQMVTNSDLLTFSIQLPATWHTDLERSTAEEIVFNIGEGGAESREAIKYVATTQDLNGYKNEFLKQFDANVIESVQAIKIGADKTSAYHIKTTEFGLEYIIVKYPKRIYVFTTQGAILENGILDTFKPIYPVQ